MWKFLEKRPFFRVDMAGLGKYSMGGYGRIGFYRVKIEQSCNKTKHRLYGPPRRPRHLGRLRAVIKYREGAYKMDACCSVVIISKLPFSLTRSRGEYLRVVGVLEMVE